MIIFSDSIFKKGFDLNRMACEPKKYTTKIICAIKCKINVLRW